MANDEYYVYPILEGTDYREHTEDHLFCNDPTCPCHEDEENQEQLTAWYDDGLIGSVDGENIYHGRIIERKEHVTMTERHAPYLYLLAEQDEPEAQERSSTLFSLGALTLLLDNPNFLAGYEHGMQQYEQWHRDELTIDDSLLLSLVRNGWGGSRYSEMWQTGSIVGWLFALFAHAAGTTADLIPIEE